MVFRGTGSAGSVWRKGEGGDVSTTVRNEQAARETRRARPVSIGAIASLILGIAAIASVTTWLAGFVLGLAAVSAALGARRTLRADPRLLGFTPSLIGMILGSVTLFLTVGPALLALAMGLTYGRS